MAKTKGKGKAVAKKQTTAVGAPLDFEADAGRGVAESADKDSYAIPFIQVLQALSPQVADDTVKGAKPGMFINTITNELAKELKVIPCAFQRMYLRWAPRSAGGGFKGFHNPIDVETNKIEGLERGDDGQLRIGDDVLKDTRSHWCLVQSAGGGWSPAVISMASTQVKKSKRWMSLIGGIELKRKDGSTYNPASFSHIYTLSTVKEENEKGKWYGINVEIDGVIKDANLYQKAKLFYEQVQAGTVTTADPVEESAGGF